MKIRKGFVSNSSSSSFLVVFDEYPIDAKHMQKMLFGTKEKIRLPYVDWEDFNTAEVAEYIYKRFRENSHPSVGQIYDLFHDVAYREISDELVKEDYKAYADLTNFDERVLTLAMQKTIEWIKTHNTQYISIMRFGDEVSRLEATIEHLPAFENIKHIRFSEH